MPLTTNVKVGDALPALLNEERAKINDIETAVSGKVDSTDARLTDTRTPTDGSVTSAKIADGTIVDGDISNTAAISADKTADGTNNKVFTAAEKTKLGGMATGATANATDANLRDRSTHTGTQAANTITGLSTVATSGSYADLTNKPNTPFAKVVHGSTASTARPANTTYVLWEGSVQPTNWIAGDDWNEVA